VKRTKLEEGIEVITFAPPSDFDPLRASPDDLRKNGFPAFPEDGPHHERYKRVWRHLKSKFRYVQPIFQVDKTRIYGGPKVAHDESTSIWSGALVQISAPTTYDERSIKYVQADWTVPNVSAPVENQEHDCAIWIGLDGANDGAASVFQAGVNCQATRSGVSSTADFYLWWEWYPNPSVRIVNVPVKPGDMVTVTLCSDGAGSTIAWGYLTNRTTGVSTSFGAVAPAGITLEGDSAEWIVETPEMSFGGPFLPLADYGEVFFSNCEAVRTDFSVIQGGAASAFADTFSMQPSDGGPVVSRGIWVAPTVIRCLYTGIPTK
jgi:Peptidase A4 family